MSGVDPNSKGKQIVRLMLLTTRHIEVRGLSAGPCCKGRRTNIYVYKYFFENLIKLREIVLET